MYQRILIIRLGAFGDVLSSMGAVKDVRAKHPLAKIYLLTTPAYKDLVQSCPWVDAAVVTTRTSIWNLAAIRKLKKEIGALNIDLVIDMQCSHRTNMYYYFLFSSLKWCGLARGSSHQILKKPYSYEGTTQLERLLQRCDIPTNCCMKPDVSFMSSSIDSEQLLQERCLIKKDYIVIFCGSSRNNPAKRWPYYSDLFIQLVKKGIKPVVIPGPDELAESSSLNAKVLVKSNGGCLDFFETAAICQHAQFVVGNDTGPTHLAAFLGQKGLALFGGHYSNMQLFLKNTNFNVLQKESISDITVNEVMDHLSVHLR